MHVSKVLMLMWSRPEEISCRYDLVEIFAGEEQVSRVFRQEGLRAASYDRCRSPDQDFLTRGGFAQLAPKLAA